jgi:hypothetical protein
MELQKMQFCSVTFVLAETILRVLPAKVTHHPVAGNLRDHACRGDAQTDAIAIDNCRLRKWKRNYWQTINQNVVWRFEQRFDREAHRTVARAQNVNPVDLNRIDNADGPPDFGIRNELAIDVFAQFRCELFGIVETTMPKFFGKNRRSGNDWPGQRSTSRFVNSCNARNSCDAEFFFVAKSAPPVAHRPKSSTDLREVTSDE